MPYSIGLAGKGGTGKTTIAGLMVKYLVDNKKTPVLAVDADSNANLNEVLGLDVLAFTFIIYSLFAEEGIFIFFLSCLFSCVFIYCFLGGISLSLTFTDQA